MKEDNIGMDHNDDLDPSSPKDESNGKASGETSQQASKGPKERLYDKIPLTVRQLDLIILALIALLIVFFVLGSLVGNGIIAGPKFLG
jgi:hypothetical protein